ncbi:uncharacterized protein IWZ02DRAFT_454502 [Phyllosticta citriasiana]|uniref:uncharacterized protein n=1 Tax=Phyllosticta citriasiana TaxID=595635 RepID=UPI0030FD361C
MAVASVVMFVLSFAWNEVATGQGNCPWRCNWISYATFIPPPHHQVHIDRAQSTEKSPPRMNHPEHSEQSKKKKKKKRKNLVRNRFGV